MPLILIISAFSAFVASGGAPKASIFMGKGDYDSAEKILGGCVTMQIVISVVLTVVLRIFGKKLLLVFGASENTISYALSYMNIYVLGTLFVELTLGLNAFITGQGFAKVGMITVLIGAAANIILDPIFIFLFKMGVAGAALATVISQGISCVWVLVFLCGKKSAVRLKGENLIGGVRLLAPCVALGLSTFIMQSSESVISVCFNSSLLKYGGDIAVGAMTILSSVMQFAMLPLQGIAQGAQPVTGYNFGAGNGERVKKSFKILLILSVSYSTLLWLTIMAFPQMYAHLFTNNAQLIEFSAGALRIYCAAMFMFGIQIACQMTFISIGNAVCSIALAVLRKFVLLIPLIYILPNFMSDKTAAVYTAEPTADMIAVVCTALLFASRFKKSLANLKTADK